MLILQFCLYVVANAFWSFFPLGVRGQGSECWRSSQCGIIWGGAGPVWTSFAGLPQRLSCAEDIWPRSVNEVRFLKKPTCLCWIISVVSPRVEGLWFNSQACKLSTVLPTARYRRDISKNVVFSRCNDAKMCSVETRNTHFGAACWIDLSFVRNWEHQRAM